MRAKLAAPAAHMQCAVGICVCVSIVEAWSSWVSNKCLTRVQLSTCAWFTCRWGSKPAPRIRPTAPCQKASQATTSSHHTYGSAVRRKAEQHLRPSTSSWPYLVSANMQLEELWNSKVSARHFHDLRKQVPFQREAPLAPVSLDRRALRNYRVAMDSADMAELICLICARRYSRNPTVEQNPTRWR